MAARRARARAPRALDRAAPIAYPLPHAAPLPPRRTRARLPRALRAAALGPLLARRQADRRDLRLHDDAAAHPRAGAPRPRRRRLRSAGRHVPPPQVPALQGHAPEDARRARRAAGLAAAHRACARHPDLRGARLRGRRRHRHAGTPGLEAGLGGADRLRRQGHDAARRRARAALQRLQERRRPRARGLRGREGEVRHDARARDRRAGDHGRRLGQRAGRQRHRREGRDQADRGVRLGRRRAAEPRQGQGQGARAPRARPGAAPALARSRHHPRRRAAGSGPRRDPRATARAARAGEAPARARLPEPAQEADRARAARRAARLPHGPRR